MLPRRPFSRLSLIIATLFAANLSLAETPAASAPFTPEQQQLIRQISASEAHGLIPQVASAAAVNVEKSIAGEKQAIEVAKEALEVGRKSVDWWLSNIGILMTLFGLVLTAAAFGIPYAMGLKKKAEWQEKLADITQKLEKAEAAQQQAEKHANEIEKLRDSALEKTSLIPNAEQLTGKLSDEVLEKLRIEKPPQVVRLIQQAWDAHGNKDWAVAKPLWELLSLIESQDANVWFNFGYAEAHSGQNWQQVSNCFQRAHLLAPDVFTCNN